MRHFLPKSCLTWLLPLLVLGCVGCTASQPAGSADAGAKQVVMTKLAPAPVGPYSQAVIKDDVLYVAGQIALDPQSGNLVNPNIEAETRQVLENVKAIVTAAGLTMADVMTVTVYLTDLRDFNAMNGIYAQYFPERPPARTTVQVAALPRNARIEISVIAEKD
jgi:2-iminobutanoate/2-iminopropanoate deaminase